MMRRVIEYLRKKQNITIDDLVVEICSSTMYYKYLSKEKNMSVKNLKLIKERLGADDLTKEEVQEFKKDLDKIIHNIMRYYISKEAFEKDIIPLIELEPQIMLCDELCIDYMIAKINFLFLENNLDEISKLLTLLEEFFSTMSVTQQLFYYQLKIFLSNYLKEDIKELVYNFSMLLDNNRYNRDYGFLHLNLAYYFLKLKQREKASHSVELALSMFNRDINLVGQIKSYNIKGFMLGEERKYSEAIQLFLLNYNNSKQVKFLNETVFALTNIITCYFGLKDLDNVIKYWNTFKKYISKIKDDNTISAVLVNNIISLFTNFEYYNLSFQLNELINIIIEYQISTHPSIIHLFEYFNILDECEKIKYVETTLLPDLTGKAHFTYCKWMLDKCVNYYYARRMYKKAIELESKYLELFKKYYFN